MWREKERESRERGREGERGGGREGERGGEERERGTLEKSFCSFPFFSFSSHRLPLFYPEIMEQGPTSPALRLGRTGRLAPAL